MITTTETPAQTYKRLTHSFWPGGDSWHIRNMLATYGIVHRPGSEEANLALQSAMIDTFNPTRRRPMTSREFKFAMGDTVGLTTSKESGTVIGSAHYATMEDQYFVRYKAGDGRQVEAWWGESALVAAGGQVGSDETLVGSGG